MGFAIAAPVGPIGVLCIRRTLAHGRLAGLISGLGAASADAVYGAVAGFGLTFVSQFLVTQQFWLGLVGGLFLLYLAMRIWLEKPAESAPRPSSTGFAGAYASTFLLTLTNPLTILSFAAIFAGLGLAQSGGDYGSAASLVIGVFLGSAGWWLLLSGGVSLVRDKLHQGWLTWINRLSSIIIALFGLIALVSLTGI